MDELRRQQMSQDAGFFETSLEKCHDSECSTSKHLSERNKPIRGRKIKRYNKKEADL